MINQLADDIGLIGVAAVLVTYFLLQIEKLHSGSPWYSFWNAFGAALIVYSLLSTWNLSAFVMEGSWFFVSLYGLWQSIRKRRAKKSV